MDWVIAIIDLLKGFIQYWGPLGLVLAMIVQAIIAPIPSELILGFAGAAFIDQYGFWIGLSVSILSALLGSLLGGTAAYYIGKKGGYTLLSRLVDEKELDIVHGHLENWGFWAVLVTRLIPFIPFDAVSYGAGTVDMKFRTFIVPTFIGLVPRIIFYSIIGAEIDQLLRRNFEAALLLLAAVIGVLVFLYYFIFRRIIKPNDKVVVEEEKSLLEQVTETKKQDE
ncbi:MAG: TVP38/TMEM64 family protein [Candidatus Odinarchaeota archaeon]